MDRIRQTLVREGGNGGEKPADIDHQRAQELAVGTYNVHRTVWLHFPDQADLSETIHGVHMQVDETEQDLANQSDHIAPVISLRTEVEIAHQPDSIQQEAA